MINIDFKMNPYHFFDSKLLELSDNFIAENDWESRLQLRQKEFPDYAFIVTDNETVLYTDFLVTWAFNDLDIRINFDSEAPLKIYWINAHVGSKEVFIHCDHQINLIHENIVIQTIKSMVHFKFKEKSLYTNLVDNLSVGIFHQYLIFKHYDESTCFFLQKECNCKTKINQKHYLNQINSQAQVIILNKIQPQQLRDDFVEFEHHSEKSKSEIKYFCINGGKAVSQANSIIGEKAFECETHQHIKHILTHEKAQSFSKPNLMIQNPHVIATHGNSIGSYNDDELFYLMQRGLELEKAQKTLQREIINHALEAHPEYESLKGYYE